MTLELQGLRAGYGRADAIVHGVDIVVEDGSIAALIGPNGAGKSTIMKALFGSASLLGGSVVVDGQRCHPVTPARLLSRGVAYVPQLRNVFPSLTVRENLAISRRGDRKRSLEVVLELFPELRSLLRRPAGRLSGGQRNMVAVARALMGEPRTLLVDEGSAGLSPRSVHAFWAHLGKLRQLGVGALVIEQDVMAALTYADHAYLLRGGSVVLSQAAEEMGRRPDLGALFLGGNADLSSVGSSFGPSNGLR